MELKSRRIIDIDLVMSDFNFKTCVRLVGSWQWLLNCVSDVPALFGFRELWPVTKVNRTRASTLMPKTLLLLW